VRKIALAVIVAMLSVSASSATAQRASSAKRCGSLEYGIDGQRPGPGRITATGVSCGLARAIALLGPAPGWRCKDTVGLRFVCRRASAVVTFYGE
jgi:hypothetical protein